METKLEMINDIVVLQSSIPKLKIKEQQEKEKVELIIEGKEDEIITEPSINNIVNKGTGAGGANTNYYGKKFEEKINNQTRLINDGYIKNSFTKKNKKKYDYYLSKTFEDKTIIFVLQNGLKMYMKKKYNIKLFRCPDEAYIIEYNTGKKVIKILEKKEQNVNGSVETKLWASPSLKREYELVLGTDFEVQYCLCISEFLQNLLVSNNKKYLVLKEILSENEIDIFFGDENSYFTLLDNWITE